MRKILATYGAPRPHWVGDGFPVRSLISPGTQGQHLSPFLMLDHAAPTEFAPSAHRRGVGEHPHRGFETVTIVYGGELEHRDSTGAGGTIGPGDVQWMTAASGILHEEFHSERFAKTGGSLEMVQLWVNLPARHKMAAPGYQTLLAAEIPSVALPGGAGTVRVIAGQYASQHGGQYDGHVGPARTFTPIDIWDVRLAAGQAMPFTLPEGRTLAVAVLDGTVEANGTTVVRTSEIVVFDRTGGDITLEAAGSAKLLVLSGEPIDEPVVAHGPFVMNTVGEIKQAMLDYQNGRFGGLPDEKAAI